VSEEERMSEKIMKKEDTGYEAIADVPVPMVNT
jgi:hypothetical protein